MWFYRVNSGSSDFNHIRRVFSLEWAETSLHPNTVKETQANLHFKSSRYGQKCVYIYLTLYLSRVTGGGAYPRCLRVQGAAVTVLLWAAWSHRHSDPRSSAVMDTTTKPRFLLSVMSPSKSKTTAKHLILGVDGRTWGKWCSSLQPDSHHGPSWSCSRSAGGVILFLPRLAA